VEVKKVAIPQVRRKRKRSDIVFSAHMEDALKRLAKTSRRPAEKTAKMERRLGRIQARHSQVNDLYEVLSATRPMAFVFTGRRSKIAKSGAS